jgi:DNA gyrase subunit A
LLGWVGPAPALAAAASGSPVDLPPVDPRRDASGIPAGQPIAAVGSRG